VEFSNPCGNHEWVRRDGFRLCQPPAGIFLQTQHSPRARFLCADASTRPIVDEPVEYSYARPNETGLGQLRITIGSSVLEAAASAVPTSIPVGGSSQLNAIVSGGTPPYAYAWSPAGSLSDPTIANPVATPSATTQYTVVVTDTVGTTAGASVMVNVGLDAVATANPASIVAGQSSSLNVAVVGGTPPYTYSWQPTSGLSDAGIQSPTASPASTTMYTATVTDAVGNNAISSVTVTVASGLQACLTLTSLGPLAVQADASCSTGPIVQYRWWSSFRNIGEPPDATTTVPFRTLLYEIPGQYTVRLEVVDASGATSAITRTLDLP
jgi:hypothetical protein